MIAAGVVQEWADALEAFAREVPGTLSVRTGQPISESTCEQYGQWVRRFAERLQVGPWAVGPERVAEWLAGAPEGSTARNMRTALRSFFGWAVATGRLEEAPLHLPAVELAAALGRGWDEALEDYARQLATGPLEEGQARLSAGVRCAHLVALRTVAVASGSGPWDLSAGEVLERLEEVQHGASGRRRRALVGFYSWALATGRATASPLQLPDDVLRLDWSSALTGFAAELATTAIATSTQETYLRHTRWLGEGVTSGPWELEARELASWLDDRNWSAETRRKVLVALTRFYDWGTAQGLIEWSPVAGVQAGRSERTRRDRRRPMPAAWAEPVDAWLTWMRASKLGEGTIDVRRWQLGVLARMAHDPWSVTTTQLAQWLSNPDWSPQCARNYRAAARSFYRWAVLDERLDRSPAERLESVKCPRRLPRPIATDVLRDALAAADDRTRLALYLGALAGLRRAEIAAVHTRDVSATEIRVIGKGDSERRLPMHPLLWEEITATLSRRRAAREPLEGWLFPSGRRGEQHQSPGQVGKLVRAVLPDPWTLHQLRHRFATMTYAEQRDLLAVQQLLGHSKPETTAVYAQVPDGALRTAVHAVTL